MIERAAGCVGRSAPADGNAPACDRDNYETCDQRQDSQQAAQAMLQWLRSQGGDHFTAHIHPANHASMRVAHNQGLHVTSSKKDGENRWEQG